MRNPHVLLLAVCLSMTISASAVRRRAVSPGRPAGPCVVRGLANFYFSADGGATWSRNAETPTKAGSWDLIVLEGEPETLVAVVGTGIFDSTDAGCTWVLRHTIAEEIHHTVHLVAGPAGRAFIWTEELVLRYDRGEVTAVAIPDRIGGLGVDPGNRDHVRVLDVEAGIPRESFDGGATWQVTGPSAGGPINSAAFDPSDFKHILAGVQTKGIRITRDGGKTWTAGAPSNKPVCTMSFVASRPDIVWATLPSQGGLSFVQRSSDAGAHLDPIARIEGVPAGVCLPVQTNLHDANLAVVAFGDFHTFDAAKKSVSASTCCGGRMERIAYSLKNPARIYVYSSLR
jgi:BNR/Asp-box repeat protein